ncbi:MAG: hypothetical protein AB3K77_02150 [Methanosarcinaceae archaeon]
MVDKYQVDISIDDETLAIIENDNLKLYAFRAVKGPSSGKPLVWYSPAKILNGTIISWSVNYGAFHSITDLNATAEFHSITSKVIDLGQSMVVNSGTTDVTNDGTEGTISIVNNDTDDCNCGISEYKDGKFNPMCAFPLRRHFTDEITPLQKVALMLAGPVIKTATVVERSLGPGIVIDLTNNHERTVSYSMDDAWDADTKGDSVEFKSNSKMNPLLINPAT